MPKNTKFVNKIPAFYRRSTLDLLMFAHVTAMRERNKMTLEKAVEDFLDLYGIDFEDYPVESALVNYNRILHNFIYVKLKA